MRVWGNRKRGNAGNNREKAEEAREREREGERKREREREKGGGECVCECWEETDNSIEERGYSEGIRCKRMGK